MSEVTGLNQLAQAIHENARDHGFYNRETVPEMELPGTLNPSMPAEKVALIHSEVSEILEALREGDQEGAGEECADVIIRVLDFCHWQGIDIEDQIETECLKNLGREYLHGKKAF